MTFNSMPKPKLAAENAQAPIPPAEATFVDFYPDQGTSPVPEAVATATAETGPALQEAIAAEEARTPQLVENLNHTLAKVDAVDELSLSPFEISERNKKITAAHEKASGHIRLLGATGLVAGLTTMFAGGTMGMQAGEMARSFDPQKMMDAFPLQHLAEQVLNGGIAVAAASAAAWVVFSFLNKNKRSASA